MNRRSAIWPVRIVVILLIALTAICWSAGVGTNPCDPSWGLLRVLLLVSPLLLFFSLVALGAITSDHRREPWVAFSVAGALFVTYLPYALAVVFWDTGC